MKEGLTPDKLSGVRFDADGTLEPMVKQDIKYGLSAGSGG